MLFINWQKGILILLLILIGWVTVSPSKRRKTILAQGNEVVIREIRVLEAEQTGVQNPAGLSFSSRANAFYIMGIWTDNHLPSTDTELVKLTAFGERFGSTHIAAMIKEPINVSFDQHFKRLLIYQSKNEQLLEIRENSDGTLNTQVMIRHDGQQFGLRKPQGTAVDPANGHLFFLDAIGPQLVHVATQADGSFAKVVITTIDLHLTGLTDVRGLAFDPRTNHLHLMSVTEQKLYELTQAGEIVAVRDLSALELKDAQAILFAPSGDLTDDASQLSLYIADSGFQGVQQNGKMEPIGAIVELSLSASRTPAASTYQSSVIQAVDASQWSPPSPDTAGVVYLPDEDRLLFSDSEVNEMPLYQGANLFKTRTTFVGGVLTTANTLNFSNEPTGIALKTDSVPDQRRLFISDDDNNAVFVLGSGNDGFFGTMDDLLNSEFDTQLFSSGDPEGVTYDNGQGFLYIADGINNEIYQVDPGANNIFDGVPPEGDDQVSSFDTLSVGLEDPEGIAFNHQNGNLYAIGKPEDILFELTTAGDLVQTIDTSAASADKPAGLAYAPSSQNSGEMDIYIVARGDDNNGNPDENDGQVYEMTLPPDTPQIAVACDGEDALITWLTAANASGYLIYKNSVPYQPVLPPGVPVTGLEYRDSDVNSMLSPVFYQVTATNSSAESSSSNEVGKFSFTLLPGVN